jgi:hypothetical protein
MYGRLCVFIYMCVYVCIYVCVCMYVYMCVCVCMYIRVCVCNMTVIGRICMWVYCLMHTRGVQHDFTRTPSFWCAVRVPKDYTLNGLLPHEILAAATRTFYIKLRVSINVNR